MLWFGHNRASPPAGTWASGGWTQDPSSGELELSGQLRGLIPEIRSGHAKGRKNGADGANNATSEERADLRVTPATLELRT